MKTIIISVLLLVSISLSWAGNGNGNGGGLGQAPINTNSFYSIFIPTDNARAVGLFITGCDSSSCATSLNTLRLTRLTERAKPQIICADSVCSPLERDIVTVSVGIGTDVSIGVAGGYAGVADAEIGVDVGVGYGGGLEFNIKGPMKLKPKGNNDFQSGGNILSESGFGSTMFSNHVMMGTKRFFGVSGRVRFYGEKTPDSQLMVGALGRDGIPNCTDELSNPIDCTSEVVTLLQRMCNDQSRCLDSSAMDLQTSSLDDNTGPRFGGFDQEELDEAMEEAQSVVNILTMDIRDRVITSRLADIRELIEQLKDNDIRQSIRDELEDLVASELEKVLAIVTNNTRFPEIDLARVERLPEAQDITEAIAELLNPLLAASGETTGETAANTKAKFCATAVGQRRTFNRYCGR